eukprot:s1_g2163.t1
MLYLPRHQADALAFSELALTPSFKGPLHKHAQRAARRSFAQGLKRAAVRAIVKRRAKHSENVTESPAPETSALLSLSQKDEGGPEPDVTEVRQKANSVGALIGRWYGNIPAVDFELADKERSIPCRLYKGARGDNGPGMIFFHGGGFVTGSLDSHETTCQAFAAQCQMNVVSVGYRLAPENPFPAGLEDALAVTKWVLSNSVTLGMDQDRVVICGESAGGALAARVAQLMRRDKRQAALQLLIYPVLDLTMASESYTKFETGYGLTRRQMEWFVSQYLTPDVERADADVSPGLCSRLDQLPPTILIPAEFDPLHDEAVHYGQRLMQAGVSTSAALASPEDSDIRLDGLASDGNFAFAGDMMKNHLVSVYGTLAVLGTVLPLSQFVPWALDHGLNFELFFVELFSTRIGGFFGWDVIVSGLVLVVLVMSEGRRLGMKHLWAPILGGLCVGVSLGLPLFLLLRERHLNAKA